MLEWGNYSGDCKGKPVEGWIESLADGPERGDWGTTESLTRTGQLSFSGAVCGRNSQGKCRLSGWLEFMPGPSSDQFWLLTLGIQGLVWLGLGIHYINSIIRFFTFFQRQIYIKFKSELVSQLLHWRKNCFSVLSIPDYDFKFLITAVSGVFTLNE